MTNIARKQETAALDEFVDSAPVQTTEAGGGSSAIRIDDVPVRVTAVLGKIRMPIADLKSLAGGSIIELDRKVGDPIDLYVNDLLVARGELVMVDGALGVSMTEVVRDDAE